MQATHTVELQLLGELSVIRDGERVTLPSSRKTRAMLAYLGVVRKAVRRERLCTLLWDLPDDPRGALRWSLSKIRPLVGEALVADRETVRLDPEALTIDFDALDAAMATAIQDVETPALEELARRYGEPFCEGLDLPRCDEFQSWSVGIREDVRTMQRKLLAELTRRLAPTPEKALPYVRRLVELDPLDEGARLSLIAILLAAKRDREAEQQRLLAVEALSEAGIEVPAALYRKNLEVRSSQRLTMSNQRVRFCAAPDGTSLAYGFLGEGPVLVKTANWLNHLDYDVESPVWNHWFKELSREHRLLRFDERGRGLSDWNAEEISFEASISDLETVIEAAGIDRFDLLGISQGAPVAIAYAVRHPERLKRLILYGSYAAGIKALGDPEQMERGEAWITLTRQAWDQENAALRQMFATLYFPGATAGQTTWIAELLRVSTSAEMAERMQRALSEIDVRPLLPQVSVPTLVFHSKEDAAIPFDSGRAVAAGIPNARFSALDSKNHLLLENDPAWPKLVSQLRAFLNEPI